MLLLHHIFLLFVKLSLIQKPQWLFFLFIFFFFSLFQKPLSFLLSNHVCPFLVGDSTICIRHSQVVDVQDSCTLVVGFDTKPLLLTSPHKTDIGTWVLQHNTQLDPSERADLSHQLNAISELAESIEMLIAPKRSNSPCSIRRFHFEIRNWHRSR